MKYQIVEDSSEAGHVYIGCQCPKGHVNGMRREMVCFKKSDMAVTLDFYNWPLQRPPKEDEKTVILAAISSP
ncbi:hypothetical protein CIPAW_09G175900 [Carya illinoinensis]|uniref:Uncharacterized protein n=1 Tax=Carya illinoinensis TaxID=32201 RepID=A0A8T1PNX8_CARIL|nr:hypothetical protein CIPAW_09G175900 [Carya illinoinensis]